MNTLEHRVDLDAFPVEEWRRIVGVDLDGVFLVSRAAVAPMRAQGFGRIVNIASTVGLAALRLQSPFVAAKAAVIHLTRSMALELGPKGVLVNAVAPGSVVTDVTRRLFYAADGSFQAQTARFTQHIPPAARAARRRSRRRCSTRLRRKQIMNGHILRWMEAVDVLSSASARLGVEARFQLVSLSLCHMMHHNFRRGKGE